MIKFIDSHCHPQFPQYNDDRTEVIKRTLDSGVYMVAVGTDLEMSLKGVELSEKYDGIWAAVGLHPTDVTQYFDKPKAFSLSKYRELLKEDKVVAIGEVGLDFYRIKNKRSQEEQKEIFKYFLDLIKNSNKPAIFHIREAYEDAIAILDQKFKANCRYPSGVVHSFTGSWEIAEKFIERGFFIGLNGIISFTNQYDEVIKNISLNNLLLETDAPFLSPVPFRGERNEPDRIKFVAQRISEIRGIKIEEIADSTILNAKKLFNI